MTANRNRNDALDQRIRETDAQFKETDARLDKHFRQTDRKINKLAGTFGQQWGKLVEALIKLDVLRLFQERGIEVKFVSSRVKRSLGGQTTHLSGETVLAFYEPAPSL